MAHVDNIWISGGAGSAKNQVLVNIKLSPSGTDRLLVDVPQDFYNCLIRLAQKAADLHEEKVRAQIIADADKERVTP